MALIEEHLDTPPNTGSSQMMVRKRNGDLEPVNLDKIVKAVERSSEGLSRLTLYESLLELSRAL